ncbi:ABC Fe3+-hydroxamate transporter, periplasmic ligand binding protein [Caballeronia sordidicola]|uniref:ABC Fe3+-hydroxamate transporter, periplasmic ligand binding protein n=1 Tax=Caballeronia sordidicola TaxID=196367 RepID=A0A158FLW4_CABSO|nr:ABC transporter substrate-binding protein [Caballeronia sordidicola]SAL20130.1 ABC Fe3+-hydroxamate transporter, periplasmic ligand binding protein [Caballeronia sordidicola]
MSMFRIFTPRRLRFAALALATCMAGALSFNAARAENAPGLATLDAAQTVTDVAGRTVRVPQNPRRILLGESRLLMAVALLEGDHPLANIVGWQGDLKNRDPQTFDVYAKKFPQINDIPLIGKATESSVSDEKALSLKPDLAIFTFGGEGPGQYNALVKQLEATGTVVVFVDFRIHPMQNTLASMKLLGEVLHRNEQADAYIKFYQEHVARVQSVVASVPDAQRPKVFIDMLAGSWGVCCHTAGNGSFGEFIKVAGGRNIAADLLPGVLGDISMEQLIVAKPDIYVADGTWTRPGVTALRVGALTSEQDAEQSLSALVARPGYDAIKAIHDGRVFGIWHNYYDSPYNIIAIEAFAKWFYPAQFKDLSVKATHDEMYRRFLAVPSDGTYWVDHPAPAKG